MARDSPDTLQSIPPSVRGSSPPASQSLPRPPGTPPAAAKASARSAPGPSRPASHPAALKTARPPTPAPLPARTSRSTRRGSGPANTARRPARATPPPLCPSPAAPAVLPQTFAPSIILRHRRHQLPCKILRHAIQRRITFLEKALHVCRGYRGGQFVLVAKQEVVRVIQHLVRGPLRQRHLALHGHQHHRSLRHGRRRRCCRLEHQRRHFHTDHLPAQHGVARVRIGHHMVSRLRQEFMDRRRGELLLDAVRGCLILQRRNRNHVDAFRQSIAVARDVISAATLDRRHPQQEYAAHPLLHVVNHSASFKPLHAGTRKLSHAPQNHQLPSRDASSTGSPRYRLVSPATLTLLGAGSPLACTTKPAPRQLSASSSRSTVFARSAHALNAVP